MLRRQAADLAAARGRVGVAKALLPLQSWRNGIGVVMHEKIGEISNMQLVENGVGVINHKYVWHPEIKPPLEWRWYRGTSVIAHSTIIGLSETSKARSNNCKVRFKSQEAFTIEAQNEDDVGWRITRKVWRTKKGGTRNFKSAL